MKVKIFFFAVLLIIIVSSDCVNSYNDGMTGRTKKHTSSGCGSCHSSGTTVTGLISGPDTVSTGATVNFTITLNGTNAGNYGVDIADKSGVLNTGRSSG